MRRRTVVIALVMVAAAALLFVVKRRSSHFDAWPRFSEIPGAVPLSKTTRVKVIDEHGPVPGAELHVARFELFESVTVGADGTIDLPTPDRVVLFASKGSRVSRLTFAYDEVPREGLVLPLLDQGASADVLVLDADGNPLVGAPLTLSMTWRILEATTGADGVAHFEPLPPGVAEVAVLSKGRAAFTWLSLIEGERTRGVIRVQPSCVLRGAVIDATSRAPIADAGVSLLGLVDHTTILSTRTNASGEFEFGVRTSATFLARGSAAGFVDESVAAPPGCTPLHIELPRGVPQLFQVVDANGRGLPNVEVKVRPREWTSGEWLFAGRSDATGRYETPPLTPDLLWFAEAQFGNAEATREWTPVSDGGVSQFELRFDRDSRRVAGRVIDAKTGAPIPGASIGEADQTERDGTFKIVLLGKGTQKRKVWADGYFVGQLVSELEGEDHVVRLERSDWVTGRVVDEKGRPIPRFAVDGVEYLNAGGTFLSSLPGKTVEVRAWGFESVEREFETHDLGTIALRRAKAMVVGVIGPDGGPIAAEVMSAKEAPESAIASLRKGELLARGSSDETGVARVFIPRGQCVLAARFPYVPSDCVHPDGGALTLQLTEPGGIEGVTLGRSLVRGNARIELASREAGTFAEQGHFKLWPLSPGHHTLRARMPSGAIWQRELDVDAGAMTQVVLSENEGSQLTVEAQTRFIGLVWIAIAQGAERVERGGYADAETATLKLDFYGLREGPADITVTQNEESWTRRVFLSSTPVSTTIRLEP